MSSLNKVSLIGNLGADPEIRETANGPVANLRIATTEVWRDKQSGERREATEWHTVTIWNSNLVDLVTKYTSKGSQIYVEGKLKTRKWQDQNGNDRYSTEVTVERFGGEIKLLGSRGDSQAGNSQNGGQSGGYQSQGGASSGNQMVGDTGMSRQEIDDDIPF